MCYKIEHWLCTTNLNRLIATAGLEKFSKISDSLTAKRQLCKAMVKPEYLWENLCGRGSTTNTR